MRDTVTEPQKEPLIRVEDLKMHFPIYTGVFRRHSGDVKAVDGVSFTIQPGETLGLVGESGCGKSTVGRALLRLYEPTAGRVVIEGDDIATLTPEALRLKRPTMQMVFQDPQAKQTLEAIIHPLVTQETQHQTQAAIAQGHRTLVFDVPLLVESGARWRTQVDRVLVVDCSVETQIQRVMARNGWDREAVQRVIAAQASRAQKLAAADWVIHNEGLSLDALRECVQNLPLSTT